MNIVGTASTDFARQPRSVLYFIFLATVISLCTPHESNGESISYDREIANIKWQSENSTFRGLGLELENHYLRLANLGLLQVETHELSQDIGFPATYFDNYFPYLNWTAKIDNLLCDLNGHACERERTAVALSEADQIDHVMGHALTDPKDTRWSLKEGSQLNIPKVDVSLLPSWVRHTTTPNTQNIHELYKDLALGCPTLLPDRKPESIREWSLINSSEAELRDGLRSAEPTNCPVWIAQENAYWLTYAADALGTFRSDGEIYDAATSNQEIRKAIAEIETLTSTGSSEAAWQALTDLFDKVIPLNQGIYTGIQLPVVAATSDQIVYKNAEIPKDFRPAEAWINATAELAMQDRVSRLDRSSYISSIAEVATLTGEEQSAEELREKFIQAPLIDGVNGVGIRSFGEAESSWSFNAGAISAPSGNFENSQIFEMINFPPEGIKRGENEVQIIFVEKIFDRNHCIFDGSCETDKFEIVRNLSIGDIDSMTPIKSIKDRLRLIYNDMYSTNPKNSYHGIGVASIAIADPTGGLLHGVYPYAIPYPLNIDFVARSIRASEWEIPRSGPDRIVGPPTWNISASTIVKEAVDGMVFLISRQNKENTFPTNQHIFVVSGGYITNKEAEGITHGIDCKIYPACFVAENEILRRNILTVVGVTVDDGGNYIPYSEGNNSTDKVSFFHKKFQIAAPAANLVVPTVDPNYLGEVSGVSFAVPMVSATVAAIRAKAPQPANHVMARIMACAKQYSTISDVVASGLLDVSCSVTIESDLVAFSRDIKGNEYPEYQQLRRGRVLKIWQDELSEGRSTERIELGRGNSIFGVWGLRPGASSDGRDIFGVRSLGDVPNEIKVTGLNSAKQEIITDLRGRLDSSLVMEFQPINDDGSDAGPSVCFELQYLLDYVPVSKTISNYWEGSSVPRCAY